ncbi:MAG TPA: SGNH/GDSL hydrolase family protein [Roseiarcus sp.]|nr:SGNH/GDSL hydrolase family protein [Roseiarcus sp.]
MEQAKRGAAARTRWKFSFDRLAGLVSAFALAFPIASARAGDGDCPGSRPPFVLPAPSNAKGEAILDGTVDILAIGSSSTQGIGASAPSFTYPAQLQADLAAALRQKVVVENAGVGGETVAATLARLKALLKREKPDLIIWQVGTNDAVRGEDEATFRAAVEKGVGMARDASVPLVLLDQQYFPAIKDVGRYERFVRAVHEIGAEYHDPVFPRYALMKAWAAESPALLRAMLWKDGFHMSDRGYGCLAQDLAADMAPLLRPRLDMTATK